MTRFTYLAALSTSAFLGSMTVGCAGAPKTRMVDVKTGSSVSYGAPQKREFQADIDAAFEHARVVVYESSRCEVIPLSIVERYQETLRGDQVIQKTPVTKKQVAESPTGDVACNQTFARNVEVLAEGNGNRVSLGRTDARGRVEGNLAQLFHVGSYAELPSTIKVFLRTAQAEPAKLVQEIPLPQLTARGQRISELLAQLEAILAKGDQGQSSADVGRSYELYAQLQDIAAGDPRVQGISARFWELYYGRKQEESRAKLTRNLEALSAAKETLKAMGDAAIPIYFQVAVNSGTMDPQALEWASVRLIRALRGSPVICAGGYQYSKLPSYGWPVDARAAAQYVNFAYGDSFSYAAQRACSY